MCVIRLILLQVILMAGAEGVLAQSPDFRLKYKSDFGSQDEISLSKSDFHYMFQNTSAFDSSAYSLQKISMNKLRVYPPSKRDFRKLGYNTLLFVGTGAVVFGILYVSPESVTNWNKKEMWKKGVFDRWARHVNSQPRMDEDNVTYNYVMHPYFGGLYYITARSCGFTVFESFLYSGLMSTFYWEYGLEAFAEYPSAQDLIITPVIGSVVGEGFFYAKKSILKNDSKVLKSKVLGVTVLVLMDPFNTFLDAVGYEQKIKTKVSVVPVGFDYNSKKMILGLGLSTQF